MAIKWHLKSYLATKHGIFTGIELQHLVSQKTGIIISHQTICRYCNRTPKSLRLETLQLICTTLGCQLNDICEVTPQKNKRPLSKRKKLSFQNTPHSRRGVDSFPDPSNYES